MNNWNDKYFEVVELSRESEYFPESLKTIEPKVEKLYCIGNLNLFKKRAIGVVGSRKCSEYGRRVAEKIGKVAAENDVVIVSGMARGIDSASHLGTLKGNGDTIAVLGTGIDIPYPRSNRELYYQIASNGLIISEYPEGYQGQVFTFPLRNRIIAALSEALVVVEAGTKSGSLITAELAAQFGRQVFAVPGNINNPYSLGTNKLLVDGASPIAVVDDIFTSMNMKLKISEAEKIYLGNDELKILEYVKKHGETSIDMLCQKLDLPPQNINGLVTVMEMKGIIAYSYGKVFIANF